MQVIRVVVEIRQVCDFHWITPQIRAPVTCDRLVVFFPDSPTNKTDHHDKTEILLKMVLITINQTKQMTAMIYIDKKNMVESGIKHQ